MIKLIYSSCYARSREKARETEMHPLRPDLFLLFDTEDEEAEERMKERESMSISNT